MDIEDLESHKVESRIIPDIAKVIRRRYHGSEYLNLGRHLGTSKQVVEIAHIVQPVVLGNDVIPVLNGEVF